MRRQRARLNSVSWRQLSGAHNFKSHASRAGIVCRTASLPRQAVPLCRPGDAGRTPATSLVYQSHARSAARPSAWRGGYVLQSEPAAFLSTAAYGHGVGHCSSNKTSRSEWLQTEERARSGCPNSRESRNRKWQATRFSASHRSSKERSSLHCITSSCHAHGCWMHAASLNVLGIPGDFSRGASSPGSKSSQSPEAVSWALLRKP